MQQCDFVSDEKLKKWWKNHPIDANIDIRQNLIKLHDLNCKKQSLFHYLAMNQRRSREYLIATIV